MVFRFVRTLVTASAPCGRRTRYAPAIAKLLFGLGLCLGLSALAVASTARAADMLAAPPPVLPLWTWTGGYVGTHVGAAWGNTKFSDPAGTSLFGDNVSTPGFIGGFQAGYDWQVPQTRFVLGIEGDLSGLASKGSNTCLASSRLFVSADCRVEPDASTTLTTRIGYAIDPQGHTLAYIKGGFAALRDRIEISTNGTSPKTETTDSLWATGWTAGAGVERALTPAWSLRLEYDYLGLGRVNVTTPPGQVQTIPGDFTSYQTTPGGTASFSQNVQEVKFALNYRFGVDPFAHWDLPLWAVTPLPANPAWAPAPQGFAAWFAGWQFEAGTRYWLSSGKFQKDLGGSSSGADANVLVSRLSYHSQANSGEFFTRVDTPQRLFVKGLVGTGAVSSGYMNDEDWAQIEILGVSPGWPTSSSSTVAYSNTRSNAVQGTIAYATGDIGYNLLQAPDYKFGAFIGYNYYRENKDAYGCVQISNEFSDCITPIPNSVLAITENDTWNSLRIGVNGDVTLLPGLRLNTDAAFIPYTQFSGVDIHWQRTDVANQTSTETGRGMGVQLDAILSYDITPAFNVGAGGRYWAMWTNDNAYTNIFGTPCPCQTLPVKTDRYGLLLQASYKFGVPDVVAAR
jgi:opacity protein-like surface antigen/outer membrane protease